MAIKKQIEIDVQTGNAQKNIDDLNKSINQTSKETENVSKTSKDVSNNLNALTGGAIGKFGAFKNSLTSVTSGFKSLKVAIISSGIGALALGILAIVKAFKSSEEGQNKFAKLMGVIGSVVGNLTDLISDLGEYIISVFENPKKAITDFANLIKENITNRFNGLLELIPNLGKAVSLLFQGKFKEAGKVAADSTGKVVLGVDSITDATDRAISKTKEFISEMQREGIIASNIANQRANADKIERGLIVQRAEAERTRAELLEKAVQKDKFSQKERIEFLKQASKIDEDITEQEIKAANLRKEAIIEENKLSKSNKEALNEEEEAKAKVIELETQRLKRQKEVTSQIQGLISQEAAEYKAKSDAIKKEAEEKAKTILDAEKKLQADLKKVRDDDELESQDYLKKIEDAENQYFDKKISKEQLEINAVEEKYFLLLEKAKQFNIDTAILEEARNLELKEIDDKYKAISNDAELKNFEEQKKIAEQERELEKQKIKDKQMVVDAIGQFADAETGIGKALLIVKQGLALQETLMDLKRITFKGAEAIGTAGISTAQNVAESSKIGFPQNIITIASAIAQGIGIMKSVKSAVSKTKAKVSGVSSSVPSVPSGGGATASLPPAFNIVGSDSTNQLADAISGQEKQPIKAYVTTNDVTTGQALERNIVQGASIG